MVIYSMGMTIKDLFRISIFSEAKLVAGKEGIENEITWFNLMEIVDSVNSLENGEFLITTGFHFDKESISKNLVKNLKSRGLSGMGVQLGYYIDEIPKHMLKEADEFEFPIIIIPKKITFSNITRTMYKELVKCNYGDIRSNETFGTIIIDILENKPLSDSSEKYLNDIFLPSEEKESYILSISIKHYYDGIILRKDVEEFTSKIIDILKKYLCNFHSELIQGSSIILFSKTREINLYEIIIDIENLINKLSQSHHNLNYLIGVSNSIQKISSLKRGYEEASTVQNHLAKIDARNALAFIEDIELLRLCIQHETRNNIISFSSSLLNMILEFDTENDTNYFETLKYYLYYNCNKSDTAKALYIHRHTLSYRLDKLAELFSINFSSPNCILKYKLAFFIKSIYPMN